MTDLNKLATQLRQELEANPLVSAAGIFGSLNERDTWARSDIDLFVITPEENDRWEGAYLRREGIRVHLQVLSLQVLRKNAATNRGNPFFTALAGVDVWFDRTGDLTRAVETGRAFTFPGTRTRACREFCPGIEALHLAEKYAAKGKLTDSRAALTAALGKLASAALAETGIYPARDIWASPDTARLPEYAEMQRVWEASQAELSGIIAGVWARVRPQLARYCSPIIDVVRSEGPLSEQELGDGKRLRGIEVPERLLDELVENGHLIEVDRLHEGLGINEFCYMVASN